MKEGFYAFFHLYIFNLEAYQFAYGESNDHYTFLNESSHREQVFLLVFLDLFFDQLIDDLHLIRVDGLLDSSKNREP